MLFMCVTIITIAMRAEDFEQYRLLHLVSVTEKLAKRGAGYIHRGDDTGLICMLS